MTCGPVDAAAVETIREWPRMYVGGSLDSENHS